MKFFHPFSQKRKRVKKLHAAMSNSLRQDHGTHFPNQFEGQELSMRLLDQESGPHKQVGMV